MVEWSDVQHEEAVLLFYTPFCRVCGQVYDSSDKVDSCAASHTVSAADNENEATSRSMGRTPENATDVEPEMEAPKQVMHPVDETFAEIEVTEAAELTHTPSENARDQEDLTDETLKAWLVALEAEAAAPEDMATAADANDALNILAGVALGSIELVEKTPLLSAVPEPVSQQKGRLSLKRQRTCPDNSKAAPNHTGRSQEGRSTGKECPSPAMHHGNGRTLRTNRVPKRKSESFVWPQAGIKRQRKTQSVNKLHLQVDTGFKTWEELTSEDEGEPSAIPSPQVSCILTH